MKTLKSFLNKTILLFTKRILVSLKTLRSLEQQKAFSEHLLKITRSEHEQVIADHKLLEERVENLVSENSNNQKVIAGLDFDLFYAKKRNHLLNLLFSQEVKMDMKIFCAQNLEFSKSQLLQDLIAGYLQQSSGFFCEIGGADGIRLSNTYFLENELNWNGIIAEPAICFRSELINNRKAFLTFDCVFSTSGQTLTFNETSDPFLSTISSYSSKDIHSSLRDNGKSVSYQVETISLNDLLKLYSAPKYIDYLSIDTEGSEYEILKAFDFSQYTFGFISVEHNYSELRAKIHDLLVQEGYTRVLSEVSMWDDYYISKKLLSNIR